MPCSFLITFMAFLLETLNPTYEAKLFYGFKDVF